MATEAENVQVFLRIRPANANGDTLESFTPCMRSLYQVDENEVKLDCESCAKRSFAELLPSAIALNEMSTEGDLYQSQREDCQQDSVLAFDGVFSESCDNSDVYTSAVHRWISNCLEGYSCSVIACGPAGAGKTRSIFGSSNEMGLAALAIQSVFRSIEDSTLRNNKEGEKGFNDRRFQAEGTEAIDKEKVHVEEEPASMISPSPSHHSQYFVEMSFVELCGNNQFRNLLRGASTHLPLSQHPLHSVSTSSIDDNCNLSVASQSSHPKIAHSLPAPTAPDAELFDSPRLGVFLSGNGLKARVKSAEEALALLRRAAAGRTSRQAPLPSGGPQQRYSSSRSHAILTLYVESKADVAPPSTKGSAPLKRTMNFHSLALSSSQTAHPKELRMGRIQLVDLAGGGPSAHPVTHSHPFSAMAPAASKGLGNREEATDAFISLSLHAFGDVVHSLAAMASYSSSSSSSSSTSASSPRPQKEKVPSASTPSHSNSFSPATTIPYTWRTNSMESFSSTGSNSVNSAGKRLTKRQQQLLHQVPASSRPQKNSGSPSHSQGPRVPYHDSKLTYLLKDCFGGLSHTALIAHVSPLVQDYHATRAALQLALMARRIVNHVRALILPVNPQELFDLRFESFLLNQLKAQFKADYEASILTSRSFSRLAPTATYPNASTARRQQGGKLRQSQHGSPDPAMSSSSAPTPIASRNPIYSQNLSDRLKDMLGEDYSAAFRCLEKATPEERVEELKALDRTLAVARSLRSELEVELQQSEELLPLALSPSPAQSPVASRTRPHSLTLPISLIPPQQMEQDLAQSSRLGAIEDLKELDLVTRMALKLRLTVEQLYRAEEAAAPLPLPPPSALPLPLPRGDYAKGGDSPGFGLSPAIVVRNGNEDCDSEGEPFEQSPRTLAFPVSLPLVEDNSAALEETVNPLRMSFAAKAEDQGKGEAVGVDGPSHKRRKEEEEEEKKDVDLTETQLRVLSGPLRRRVDELRETLQHLQQNQAVALEGCLEQLLQAAEDRDRRVRRLLKLHGAENHKAAAHRHGNGTLLREREKERERVESGSVEEEARSEENGSLQSLPSKESLRSGLSVDAEVDDGLTPLSVRSNRSAAPVFEDAYYPPEDEEYMSNPLLHGGERLLATGDAAKKSVSTSAAAGTERGFDRDDGGVQTEAEDLIPTSELLALALRENRALRAKLDETSHRSNSDDTAGTTSEATASSTSAASSFAIAELSNLLKEERLAISKQALEIQQLRLALQSAEEARLRLDVENALTKQHNEQLSARLTQLDLERVGLLHELRESRIPKLEEDVRAELFRGEDVEDVAVPKDVVGQSSSSPGDVTPIDVRSPFSRIAAVYSQLMERDFFLPVGEEELQPPLSLLSSSGQEPNPNLSVSFATELASIEIVPTSPQVEALPENEEVKALSHKVQELEGEKEKLVQREKSLSEKLAVTAAELLQAQSDLHRLQSEHREKVDELTARVTTLAISGNDPDKTVPKTVSGGSDERSSPSHLSSPDLKMMTPFAFSSPIPSFSPSSPQSPQERIEALERQLTQQAEEAAAVFHNNQQLRYEVSFKAKLVANANRSVSELLTLLSEKKEEIQRLHNELVVLRAAHELSKERSKERRLKAMALAAAPIVVPPPPLTSQTAEPPPYERPISPLTEDSFSIGGEDIVDIPREKDADRVRLHGTDKDPDQEALEHGLLLSMQNQLYGTDMYESLTPEYEPVLAEYIRRGLARDKALLLIFEERYGMVPDSSRSRAKSMRSVGSPPISPQRRLHKERDEPLPPPPPQLQGASMALKMNMNLPANAAIPYSAAAAASFPFNPPGPRVRVEVGGAGSGGIAPSSSPSHIGQANHSYRKGSGEGVSVYNEGASLPLNPNPNPHPGSPSRASVPLATGLADAQLQQDEEIRLIMSRGYSYELAAQIYFKKLQRSAH